MSSEITPVMSSFWSETSPLRQSDLDWLRAQGVSTTSIAHDPDECGYLLSRALVTFDDDGSAFSFASETPDRAASSAFVLPARDESGEVVDIIAWRPKDRVVAAWRRQVPMAGLQNILAPRLGEPLSVFSDPADWLKADRRGVLVIDMAGAAIALRDAGALAVHSRQQARHLRRAFASLTPHINIQSTRKEAA